MGQTRDIRIRQGDGDDLAQVNAVVEGAVMGWDLPARVKRLSLVSYRYQPHDLDHLRVLVAEAHGEVVGVAALEDAESGESPAPVKTALLHGLYVAPRWQRQGVGGRLLAAVVATARADGYRGLLVKANRQAQGFFVARGLRALAVADPARDYPYRFWLDL